MKKQKLFIVSVLVCLLSAVSLFAQGAKEQGTSGKAAGNNDEVTLRFGWWGGDSRHKAYIAAAEEYMKLHPNVKIVCEYSGWDGYREKLYTQLAGGNAPDIFQNHYTWLQEQSSWSDKPVIKDLNDYKQYFDLSIYPEGFLSSNTMYDGKLLALPSSVNTFAIVGNKALLEQIGFKENQDWTWEDFFTFSEKLKQIDPSYYFENGLSAGSIHMYWFLDYLAQLTGKPFDTDYQLNYTEAELTKAFQFFKKYFDSKVVEPLGTLELYNGNFAQNPTWINGKSAILFGMLSTLENYVNAMGDYAKDATVIKLPLMKDAKDPFNKMIVGQCFSISAASNEKNAVEAAKFLNWMNTDPEAGKILKLSRGIPVSEVQNQALANAGLINPLVITAQKYATGEGQGVGQTVLSRNNEITKIGSDIISAIAFNQITPEEAAKQYHELITEKLVELKDATN